MMEQQLVVIILLLSYCPFEAAPLMRPSVKLHFNYYAPLAQNQARASIRVTASVHFQNESLNFYSLMGNLSSSGILFVKKVQCIGPGSGAGTCKNTHGTYVSLEHITAEIGILLKIEQPESVVSSLLDSISKPNRTEQLNFTCTVFDGFITFIPKPTAPYELPYTSLFGIIFLSICAVLVCGLCTLWVTLLYYRRFVQHRKERQVRQALAQSTEQMLAKSPVIIFAGDNNDNENGDEHPMCAICLESFKAQDKIRKLVCQHSYHLVCIDPWLLSHQSCPLCNRNILRNSIPSISSSVMALRNNEITSDISSSNSHTIQITSSNL